MRAAANTPRIRASRLLSGAKKRSIQLGLEFDLDLEWIAERIERGFCEVTGLPFDLITGRSSFAPSLDRINPSKGYTKDNVKVVAWAYNAAKGAGTHDDVLRLAQALVAHDQEQSQVLNQSH